MSRSTQQLADQLVSHIKYIELTRVKSEALFLSRSMVYRDISFVYSGLFLELVTSFEKFLEDLFVGILSKSLIHPSAKVYPRVTFNSALVCRDVMTGGKDYVDWLPYDYTLKRAKAYFRNGLPFSTLTKAEKQSIQKMSWVRNAIAHKSRYSNSKFTENVLNGLLLTSKEQNPVGYLRSIYINYPNPQRRFEEIVSEITSISNRLVN